MYPVEMMKRPTAERRLVLMALKELSKAIVQTKNLELNLSETRLSVVHNTPENGSRNDEDNNNDEDDNNSNNHSNQPPQQQTPARENNEIPAPVQPIIETPQPERASDIYSPNINFGEF